MSLAPVVGWVMWINRLAGCPAGLSPDAPAVVPSLVPVRVCWVGFSDGDDSGPKIKRIALGRTAGRVGSGGEGPEAEMARTGAGEEAQTVASGRQGNRPKYNYCPRPRPL